MGLLMGKRFFPFFIFLISLYSTAGSTFLFNDRFFALNYSIAASRSIYLGFKSVCFFNNQCYRSCEIFQIFDNFVRFDFNNMYSSNDYVTTQR